MKRTVIKRTLLPSLSLALCSLCLACGDSGDGSPPLGYENSFGCESVPACYTTALAALRQCVGTDPLTLGPPNVNSGVAKGASCTGGDVIVSFSDFGEKAPSTPSKVTITKGGSPCMILGRGTGTLSGKEIPETQYTLVYMESPDGSEVKIKLFEDGVVGVECGGRDRYAAAAGALASCPQSVLRTKTTRDENITELGVDLIDLADAKVETLFSCQ